jgi:hypothetical protein
MYRSRARYIYIYNDVITDDDHDKLYIYKFIIISNDTIINLLGAYYGNLYVIIHMILIIDLFVSNQLWVLSLDSSWNFNSCSIPAVVVLIAPRRISTRWLNNLPFVTSYVQRH